MCATQPGEHARGVSDGRVGYVAGGAREDKGKEGEEGEVGGGSEERGPGDGAAARALERVHVTGSRSSAAQETVQCASGTPQASSVAFNERVQM